MLTLYSLLGVMLLCALALITIPFIKQKMVFSFSYLVLFLFLVSFPIIFYQLSGDKLALFNWMKEGKMHYELMAQFHKLGGVEGAISKIEQMLKDNPNDPKGWTILGKLYLSQQENEKATAAFERAEKLKNR